MIKIYTSKHSPRSSAFRCVWFAEELGIPYELIPLDFQKQEHKSKEYLALNPNGKVPTMVDGDLVLFESIAICYYLMEIKQALEFVGTTPEEHAVVNQWCLWGLLHLYSNALYPLVMQHTRGLPETDATKAACDIELPRFLNVLEGRLQGQEYIALDHFTLADLTIMSVMESAARINYDLSLYPGIITWMKRVAERPAYRRVTAS